MHRSGTSFLVRALNLSGVYIGPFESLISNEWITLKDNPRGHWENKAILDLTKTTFSNNNGSWERPPTKIEINENLGKQIKKNIDGLINSHSLAAGFKDPRIPFILKSWIPYLPKKFIIVAIFRDPLKVAESLKKRDQFSYDKSIALWKKYNEKLLECLEKYPGFLLDFDWPEERLVNEIHLICKKLGLPEMDLSDWYDKKLFRSDKTYKTDYLLSKDIEILYSKLKERSEKNAKINLTGVKLGKLQDPKVVSNLLSEIQKQGKYFKELYSGSEEIILLKENALVNLHKELMKKTNEIKEKKSEIGKLEEEINKLQKEKKSEIGKLEEEINKLQKEKKSEIGKLEEEINKLQKEKKSEIGKLEEEINKIRGKIIETIKEI